MFISYTTVRTRYADVDQMGFVYYGNYATYYEVGRAAAMREIGTSYKEMEEKGIIMPVLSMTCQYKKPAHYDELLTVKTIVKGIPKARMEFNYEIFNEKDELLNKGETTLVFLSKASNRPVRIPSWFEDKLKPYFEQA
ncbi:MAG: acyl-CoA thioesterase [Bacteroidales bacterium]|nr:acyl-CoA thioesterase [Bacteroidales bacterium]MCF8327623.1 acyl-CoA thioesterase [Bacteroidales bacterium]